MPFDLADWSINASGDLRYIGDAHGGASPSYATVEEVHRGVQDLADNAGVSGDDLVSIASPNPSNRQTDQIIELLALNIDDASSEHIFGGSIIQAGGATIYDGVKNFGNTPHIELIQNGALIVNDFWNSNGGLNADATQGISHQFMVKVRDGGADIDGRRLIGVTREFGFSYAEFTIPATARGENVLALAHATDLNNQTLEATVATWSDVVNTEGYALLDIDNDSTTEPYYSNWDRATRTIGEFYERLKWLTRRGSAETLYGISGEVFRGVTHEIDIDGPTGTFVEPEAVSWTGGTGQLLAIDSTTAGTKMWIQLLTGNAPSDNDTITGGTSSATADVNVTVTERPVSTPFVGQSTGSAVIGAYGLGIEATDLSASDLLTDLGNTTRQPPNFVTFTIGGLVSGEDYVLVGPEDGSGGLDEDQFTLDTALTGAAETSVDVNITIPSDSPASGTLRIQLDDGTRLRVPYTSFTGSVFTIPSTDFSTTGAAVANEVYISYLDLVATGTQEQFTVIFSSSRTLFLRVRDGGVTPIKPFESTATLSSGGGSATAIRTSDA